MATVKHALLSGTELHEAFPYVQASDPGAVGVGKYWLDTSVGTLPVLKRRNAANDGWLTISAPPLHPSVRPNVGFDAASLTAVTAFATNTTYAFYLGKTEKAYASISLRCRVTTAAATITWAEVGIATGAMDIGSSASLTRRGFTNVAATFNSAGVKTTSVAVSSIAIGDDIWALLGSQASTPFQVRGGLADDLQSGFSQSAAVRISTMGAATAFALLGATVVPAWLTWSGS